MTPNLLIATHSHGYVTPAYAHALATATAYLAREGVQFDVVMIEDSLVDRARDRAAAALLRDDYTHLLFIDADIDFHPQAITRLLAADKDLIVAAYRSKNERNEFSLCFLPDAHDRLEECPTTGAIKIARAGTGFMMIRRCVFERISEARPDLHYTDVSPVTGNTPMVAYFEHIIMAGRRWSEDFTFCERWRGLGGDVWLDPTIQLGHWGPMVWRGSIAEHIKDDGNACGG